MVEMLMIWSNMTEIEFRQTERTEQTERNLSTSSPMWSMVVNFTWDSKLSYVKLSTQNISWMWMHSLSLRDNGYLQGHVFLLCLIEQNMGFLYGRSPNLSPQDQELKHYKTSMVRSKQLLGHSNWVKWLTV